MKAKKILDCACANYWRATYRVKRVPIVAIQVVANIQYHGGQETNQCRHVLETKHQAILRNAACRK